jgi:outer membrane protein TolC
VERANTEVTLYALNQRVNGLFFGILLTDGQLARLDILTHDLEVTLGRVEALVRGGLATAADVDAIRVELLRAAQQKIALMATRDAYRAMLGMVTGRALGAGVELVRPEGGGLASAREDLPPYRPQGSGLLVPEGGESASARRETGRPEMGLFEAQIAGIEARKHTLNAAITPRISLFATGGYGRPSLNMLANEFKPYYVVGARMAWNIGSLYTRRNDLRKIGIDRRGVELRRDAFLLNNDLDITLTDSNITRLREQLQLDDEIIALRAAVLRAAEAKISGGTLSGSDLARDINALEAARHDKLIHEMELLMAVYEIKFVTNN